MNLQHAAKRRQDNHEAQKVEDRSLRQQSLAQVGKWEWHLSTRKFIWCEEMYRIFELSPQQMPLRTGTFFNGIHPDDRERVVRAFGRALVGEEPYRIEHRIVRPDGSVRLVQGEAEVKFDEQGRPVSMCGTIRDITGFGRPGESSPK